MEFKPKSLGIRKSPPEANEVDILFNLFNDSSTIVRLNVLETITHLPLSKDKWSQVIKLVRQELKSTKSFEDREALIEIANWAPYESGIEKEINRIEASPEERNKLINAVRKNQHENLVQEPYNSEWLISQAPGFVLFSESELLSRKLQIKREIPKLASKISRWYDKDDALDFLTEEEIDPILITLLFGYAARDGYNNYDLGFTNNLLELLEKVKNFRPDLYGLFEEYLRCVKGWVKYWSAPKGRLDARWFQLDRDAEDNDDRYSWPSWQIAWTVSRGGLKGLISSLEVHLNADDDIRQIAALALVADSADYVLQERAAIFGGGIRPAKSALQIKELYSGPRGPGRPLDD